MFNAIIDKRSSDRGLTTALWKDIEAINGVDPRYGMFWFDDFHELPTGRYTATQASQGTFAIDATVANTGVALADCNSTTVTQGINVQAAGTNVSPAAGSIVTFEARVKAADTATGPEFFLGLSIVDTTIIGTSANSSTDHVGFESVSDDNILLFHTQNAGTRVSGATSPHTLVEDTYVKLGFRIIGADKCEVWVNGQMVDVAFAATPDIPIGSILVPSLVCQSGGTTDPIVHIDWWAVGQNGRAS